MVPILGVSERIKGLLAHRFSNFLSPSSSPYPDPHSSYVSLFQCPIQIDPLRQLHTAMARGCQPQALAKVALARGTLCEAPLLPSSSDLMSLKTPGGSDNV